MQFIPIIYCMRVLYIGEIYHKQGWCIDYSFLIF